MTQTEAPEELAAAGPMTVHGRVVKLVHEKSPCGGDYAWARLDPSGSWTSVGCVCHNPALGV